MATNDDETGDVDDFNDVENWTYCTDEERAEFQHKIYNGLEFDNTAKEQMDFFRLSLVAFKLEIRAIERHFQAKEYEPIIWHLHNLLDGVPQILSACLLSMIPPGDRSRIGAEMLADKITRRTGNPMVAVQIADGLWAVGQEDVTVPDNPAAIMEMWEQQDRRDGGS